MKKLIFTLLCFTAFLLSNSGELKATHAAGGSITYEYVGDSTGIPYHYCITLTLYRREQGASLGSTQTIDITSSCGSVSPLTVTQPPAIPQGSTPRGDTNCIDKSDPGYADGKIEEYVYTGCVILPGKCHDYTFSWGLCCRNGNIDNLVNASSENLYLESKLNNTIGPNTSPAFLNPGAKFFCVGQPFSWSQAAAEPDQDSMRFTLQQPWDAANSPINWAPGFSTQQPMTTIPPNSFQMDQSNGLMTFTPAVANEVDVIKIVVEEYRYDTINTSWLLVGTAIREMQIPVLAQCNPIATTGVSITQGESVGGVTSHRADLNADSLAKVFNVDTIGNSGLSGLEVGVDIIGYECYDTVVNITVNGDLKCASITDNGSEFRLIGPDSVARPVMSVDKNCQTTLLTGNFDLHLHKPLDVNGDYLLQVKKGDDGNTIENECGFGVKEFFSLIIRVENCPELIYNLENVTVEEDEQIRIDWHVDPQSFRPESEELFSEWSIWRAPGDNKFEKLNDVGLNNKSDVNARSYIDDSMEPSDLDNIPFQYRIQLVQNFRYRTPTNSIDAIRLSDTLNNDSTAWDLYWTEYNGWASPTYELFIGQKDTVNNSMEWKNYEGPDSNFYASNFAIPEPVTDDTAGLYAFKVEATDPFDPDNSHISESNWIWLELGQKDPNKPEDPEEVVTPNVFTPNGDGRNDVFYVSAKYYTDASIEVYNRWGKLVFRSSDAKAREAAETLHWDGRDLNSGEILADGVYYYVLSLRDEVTGESKNLNGSINIFKN